MQGVAEEGSDPGFLKEHQDGAGAGEIPKSAGMIGQSRDAGGCECGRVALVESKQPALELRSDDDSGIGKDLVRRFLRRFLDGESPDKGLEGSDGM